MNDYRARGLRSGRAFAAPVRLPWARADKPPARLRMGSWLRFTHRAGWNSSCQRSTGSYPPGWKGWHFNIRRNARKSPYTTPCLATASMAYWEQVGINRQEGGNRGERNSWYIFIRKIQTLPIMLSPFTEKETELKAGSCLWHTPISGRIKVNK